MRILRTDETARGHTQRVFRHSPAADLLAVGALLAATIAVAAAAWFEVIPLPIAGFAIVFLALFAAVAVAAYRRTLSPDNWLLAFDGSRILIKLRSQLNRGAADDGSSVIELESSDIRGFRITRSTTTGHGAANDPAGGVTVFLDILLRGSTDEVAQAIREERARRPPGAVWRHYPVTLPDPDTLRLEWRGRYARISPGIDEALRILGGVAPIMNSASENVDLGTSGMAPVNADVERQIRLLAEQGKIMDATVLASRGLGLGQSEARKLVEGMTDRRITASPDEEHGSAM